MKTCFVIMPIGDQVVGGVKVTAAELKRRHDDANSDDAVPWEQVNAEALARWSLP